MIICEELKMKVRVAYFSIWPKPNSVSSFAVSMFQHTAINGFQFIRIVRLSIDIVKGVSTPSNGIISG